MIKRLKPKRNTSGTNSFTPISLDLAKQLQSALLVEQYQRLIKEKAKKESEKTPNKDLTKVAADIYQRSGLFQWSNKNMEYEEKISALFNQFKHTDKGSVQNLGGVSEIIRGSEEQSFTARALSGLRYAVNPDSKNPYMRTLYAAKTGELKNYFGDLAAYETNKGDGLTLTVTPNKHLAANHHKTPQYEKKQYLIGSFIKNKSVFF
ncbi:hypothetical protein KVM81_07240 [Helicobacter pylori]|nr:hypothetical protein KVM81_07240 [Helicobacter pylori]